MSAEKQAAPRAAAPTATRGRPLSAQTDKTPAQPIRKQAPQRSSSGAIAGVAVFIFMVMLMIGAGAAIYFNIGGVQPTIADALGLYSTVKEESGDLDQRASELDSRETEIAQLQLQLEQMQAQLDEDRAAFESQKEEFAAQQATATGVQADIEKTAQSFNEMDAVKAAEIISVLGDSEEAVLIMQSVSPETFANILENMDPTLAATILSKVLID